MNEYRVYFKAMDTITKPIEGWVDVVSDTESHAIKEALSIIEAKFPDLPAPFWTHVKTEVMFS